MTQGKTTKIGELLLRESLINETELKKSLLIQKNQKIYKLLGEICIEQNFLSKDDLIKVLIKYNKQIKLGELLINLESLNADQLNEALKTQKLKGGKLGEILVELGFITQTSLINILSKQLGIPKIIPDIHQIDRSLLKGIGEEFLFKNKILPAFKNENSLTVIMANPEDKTMIRNLSQILKCKIEPAIAAPVEIQNTIKNIFIGDIFKTQKSLLSGNNDLVIGDEPRGKRVG